MRLKRRLLILVSERTKFSKSYLGDLIATRKRPSAKRALELEKLIGVHHDFWLYRTSDEIKQQLTKKLAKLL